MSNLPPETRQRVEDALRTLGGGTLQGMTPVFVTQFADAPLHPLQQAQSDQAWVHWEYGVHEWALFDKVDWGSRRRTFWLLIGGGIVFLIATALSGLTAFTTSPEQVTFIFALLLGIAFSMCCLASFIFSVAYLASYREAKTRHKARQNHAQPHKVTISQKGVWEAGTYFPLNDDDLTVNLREVKMTSAPPVLHFRRTINKTYDASSPQSTTLRVLVPRGHEEEAAQLMQRFRTEVTGEQKKGYTSAPREPD